MRARAVASAVLVVLGVLLVPVSVLAVWTRTELTDTDRFVAAVTPVLDEPAVRTVLVDRVGDAVVAAVDVRRLVDGAVDGVAGSVPLLARGLRPLAGLVATGVDGGVRGLTARVLDDPRTDAARDRVVRATHEQLVAALAGGDSALTVRGDGVVLDLTPFVAAVTPRLAEAGLDVTSVLPTPPPTVPLLDADTLARAQTVYRATATAAAVLPWVAVAALGAGIALGRDRRRVVLRAAGGVAAGSAVLAVVVALGRSTLLGAVPGDAAVPAAAVLDALVAPLDAAVVTVGVVALLVGLGAYLAGRPSARSSAAP